MLYPLRWSLSLFSTLLRLGAGRAGPTSIIKDQLPILYEFAACPWCRIARESISEAGLSVLVRPCPKGGEKFRPSVQELGGKAQFPFYMDEFVPKGMYESGDISKAMRTEYGAPRPLVHWLGLFNGILSSYAVLLGFTGGGTVSPSKPQSAPLVLYGNEASPSARLIKARLSCFELEYIWHPAHRGSPRLEDPATGETLLGGADAINYLASRYAS